MSRFVTMLNDGLVVWGSKNQTSTLLLSTEVKFIASTSATQKLIQLRGLLSSINYLSCTATPLLIDNQGAILLIKNSLSSKHSKHIELCYYFICEKFANGTIATKYISTDKQLADGVRCGLHWGRSPQNGLGDEQTCRMTLASAYVLYCLSATQL